MAVRDDAFRLAVWHAWGQRCAWCDEPVAFNEMELDDAIAKSLKGKDLEQALSEQNLSDNYDTEGTENLVPACGRPCNRRKRAQRLPTTGAVSAVLEKGTRAGTDH